MNKIKLIVDSTVDLTPELYKEYDMHVVPLSVNFGEDNYKDGETITRDELYARVKKDKMLPSTAAVSPQTFEEIFRKYLAEGYEIIYVGIGSTLSTCFQSAFIAKNAIDSDKIYLVDSKNLSSASGLLALKAGKMIKEGKSAKEIAEAMEKAVPNVVAQFSVETLDYLHKGGRCSGTAKVIGHLFHVHPHLLVRDGKLAEPLALITIAGNLLEMFGNIKYIASNSKFVLQTSTMCPSIMIKKMAVTGK